MTLAAALFFERSCDESWDFRRKCVENGGGRSEAHPRKRNNEDEIVTALLVPCIVYKQSYVYCKQLSCVANSHIRTKLGYPEKRGVPQGTVVYPIIFTLQINRVVNHNLKYGLIDVDENENLASKYFFSNFFDSSNAKQNIENWPQLDRFTTYDWIEYLKRCTSWSSTIVEKFKSLLLKTTKTSSY